PFRPRAERGRLRMPRPLYDRRILCANRTRCFGGQGARAGSTFGPQTGGVTLATLWATPCDPLITTRDLCKNNFGFRGTLTLTAALCNPMLVITHTSYC